MDRPASRSAERVATRCIHCTVLMCSSKASLRSSSPPAQGACTVGRNRSASHLHGLTRQLDTMMALTSPYRERAQKSEKAATPAIPAPPRPIHTYKYSIADQKAMHPVVKLLAVRLFARKSLIGCLVGMYSISISPRCPTGRGAEGATYTFMGGGRAICRGFLVDCSF